MEQDVINMGLDNKNIIVMKLLHYFITEKNYNPIILQGAEDEIWLENLDEDYKIVRIVSNYIHNNEQLDFDIFKTKRIVKKIKKKTLSFKLNTLSIFLDLGDNVKLSPFKDVDCIKVVEEDDLTNNSIIKSIFPDMSGKLKYNEDGVQLFLKITNDINNHNKVDAEKVDEVFKKKNPIITYGLIFINICLYIIPILFNTFDKILADFCIYAPSIRAGEYYRLITGMFLHANIIHLLFNCYALFVLGSQLESFIGKTKYIIMYIFSGVMGSLFSMIFTGNVPSIGASGAIFGIMGSTLYFGYHYRVFLGNIIKSQIIPLILINLAIGFMMSGIDNFAHIGGLIGGLVITMGLGIKYHSTKSEQINGMIISAMFLAFSIYMAFFYTV